MSFSNPLGIVFGLSSGYVGPSWGPPGGHLGPLRRVLAVSSERVSRLLEASWATQEAPKISLSAPRRRALNFAGGWSIYSLQGVRAFRLALPKCPKNCGCFFNLFLDCVFASFEPEKVPKMRPFFAHNDFFMFFSYSRFCIVLGPRKQARKLSKWSSRLGETLILVFAAQPP